MPGTTTYGVDLLVELAIGQAASAGHWGTSRWGQTLWGTSDTTLGDWVDVTCDVVDGLRLTAGSNTDTGVTRAWESASAAFTLDGSQWDPWNGPHRAILGDRTPVRVSWRRTGGAPAWVRAFTGFIATRGYDWDPVDQSADVACVDGTSILVASDAPAQASQAAGETAAARVNRVASNARWPGAADVTAGGSTLVATTLSDPAWDELRKIADTDLALLWITRAGALAYRPRGRVGPGQRLTGRLVACPGGPNDIQVMTLGRSQPSVTRNRVWTSHRTALTTDPAPAVVYGEDRESIARYQPHDFKATDLWHDSDAWSATLAQLILGTGAWPSSAPGAVALDTISGDTRVAPVLLALEPDQTFDVVDDGGTVWREAVVGWDVTVSNGEALGVLELEDVSRWARGAVWGTGKWGTDTWAIGGI